MYGEKKLEDYILDIYAFRGNAELRWSQIRNEIKSNYEIPEEERFSEGLSVKLTRAVRRLCEDGLLERHSYGHQNVRYSLTKKGEKTLFSSYRIALERKMINWGAGCYTPGCKFKDYVKRMQQQWMELFDIEFPKEELLLRYKHQKSSNSRKKVRISQRNRLRRS